MIDTNNDALSNEKQERKDQADLISSQKSLQDKESILEILKRDPQYDTNKKIVRHERDSIKMEKLWVEESELTEKLSAIEAKKGMISSRMEWVESVENLSETVQSKKRTDMLPYAQENDASNAERIEWWLWRAQELRANGMLTDVSGVEWWVKMSWIWLLANTAAHNKVLEDNFPWQVQKPIQWKNHSWNMSELNTVRKGDLDKKLKENDWVLSWNYKLESKEFLTWEIFSWIDQNFEWVENDKHRKYLLQLINPDMFTRLYFNSTNSSWHSRQAVLLKRYVNNRKFNEYDNDYDECGVFLVWKC